IKVWIKIEAVNIGYEIAREKKRAVELDMQRRELALQKSVLLRPMVLKAAARERLNLGEFDPQRAIKIIY
ncbi:MAG: hypothetical protein D6719_11370, partial [Candidatus Dadabacteria bacterium]